jgi:mRNA interferase RelE/StbE
MTRLRVTTRCRQKDLPLLPSDILADLVKKLDMLISDPNSGKPLGQELRRYRSVRLGRYRIIYRYDPEADVVWVVAVGTRKEGSREDIYRKVVRLLQAGKIELE